MTDNVKYLGVQFECQLNWNKHVDIIKTKVNRTLEFIKYSKKYLPQQGRKMF